MTTSYTMNSVLYQIDGQNTVRTYTLVSNVVITTLDASQKIIQVEIQDTESSSGDPADLYSGTFIGTKKSLVGNNGYSGTASIQCGVLVYNQPAYALYNALDNTTAYWQKGTLTLV